MTDREKVRRARTMLVAGLIVLAGLSVSVRGVWLAWRPGGWMAAGLLIAVPALFAAYDAFREK